MTDTEKAARPRLIDRLPIDRKDNRRAKENGKETKSKIKDFLKASYRGTDKIFLLTVILLMAFGTLMVFSAGTAYAEKRYGDIFYFVKRQTIWILIGFAVMMGASQIPIKQYKKYKLAAG